MSMTPGRGWTWLWIALALALVVRTGIRERGVIHDHLEFGRRMLFAEDLYAPFGDTAALHAPYPPGFGLVNAPLAWLPARPARIVWALLQVVALIAIARWLRDALDDVAPALARRFHLLLLISLGLAARYVLRDTHGGGGNLINLACALTGLGRAQRGCTLGAAAWLGLSLATKPTHVLFVPLLCVLGYCRAALGAVFAAALWTGAALLLARQGFAPLLRWWDGSVAYAAMADPFAAPQFGFPEFTWMNQCLRCALARWLGTVPPEPAALVPGLAPGLGLPVAVTAWIARGASALLLATTAWTALRSRTARLAPRAAPWLVAAVCALSLLLSPISWKAHHVALLPAFFLLLARGLSGHRALLWVLATYAALLLLGEDLTGKAFKEWQQSLYVITAGTVVLWALCLRAARPEATPEEATAADAATTESTAASASPAANP